MNLDATAIREATRRFIIEHLLFGDGSGLRDDASFLEQGIIDSTGVLELVTHLEQTYGVKVEDAEMIPENLDSIDGIVAFLQGKLSSGAH